MTTTSPVRTTQEPRPALRRLGFLLARHRRWVVATGTLLVIVAGVVGAGAVPRFVLSRFEAPGSESDRAADALTERFDTGTWNVVLLVTANEGTVDDPDPVNAGRALTADLAAYPGVADAESYWTRDGPDTLRSDDARHALVLAHVPGDATEVRDRVLPELVPRFTGDGSAVSVRAGGAEQVFRQVAAQARDDFLRAEMIIFPMVFLLLFLLLRSALAASLSLATGLFAMLVALALLRGALGFAEISTFALNLTLVMGLALGVDYSLFLIYRFREELRRGSGEHDHPTPLAAAVATAVETAGRTVIFSGVTVAASVAVLFALPFDFLRSFAYAGVAVVTGGVAGAVFILPAALAAVGPRIARPAPSGEGRFWHRTATLVMRRPVAFGGAALVVLLALGAPAIGLNFGTPDARVLPEGTSSREVQEVIRTSFSAEAADAIQVVSAGPVETDEVAAYAVTLSQVSGVAQVDSLAGAFRAGRQVGDIDPSRYGGTDGTWLSVVPAAGERLESDVIGLVRDVRAVPAPFEVNVGGYPAELADYRASVVDRLPLVFGLILAVTFVILFLMTGSLLLPLKATALNVLSLSVMFGGLVWIFQDGNLSGLLGFTATGALEPSIPILMFCIAYGLSMDYEVFMLARIKEDYDQTGDTVTAVATGLRHGAPLITAAAAILALCFATYGTAGVVLLKILGIGMALVVIVDATIIRAVLLPASMRLAGRANWWAPGGLRRVLARLVSPRS